MKKGDVAIPHIIAAVIAIGVIAFGFWIMNTNPKLLQDLFNTLLSFIGMGGGPPPEMYEPAKNVIEAIQCSYYRCLKGCNSEEVKIIDEDYGFDCKAQYCDDEHKGLQDNQGKICGENSKKYPVVAKVLETKGEILNKEDLGSTTKCLNLQSKEPVSKLNDMVIIIQRLSCTHKYQVSNFLT